MKTAFSRLRAAAAVGPVAILLVASITGFPNTGPTQGALPGCENSIAVHDSRRGVVLVYEPQANQIRQVDTIEPVDSVISEVVLRCEVGAVFYKTEKRNRSAVTGVMHMRAGGKESTLVFDEGINQILPLGPRQLLVNTKVLRQAPIEPALGDLAREEAIHLPLPSKESLALGPDTRPPNTHVYLDDVVLDLAPLRRVRSLRGPLMSHSLQDDRLITYAADGGVYEFDPLSGHRKRIHDRGRFSWGVPLDGQPMMHFGVKYFVWGNRWYAVNGESLPARPTVSPLPANTVLRFDDVDNTWIPLAEVGFKVDAYLMAGNQLIMAGSAGLAVFDFSSERLRFKPQEFKGLAPAAIAAIGEGWLLALTEPSDLPDKYRPTGTQLWLLSKEDLNVRLVHRLPWLGPVRMSTEMTPVANW